MKAATKKKIGVGAVVVGLVAGTVAAIRAWVKAAPCTPGETKCDGYDLYRCSLQGVWELEETNSPTCGWEPWKATFEVTDLLIEPEEVYVGETVTVSVLVTNVGNLEGTKTVVFEGLVSKDVTLDPGDSARVTFEVTPTEPGTYAVKIDVLEGSFICVPKPAPDIRVAPGSLVIIPETVFVGREVTITATAMNYGDAYGKKDIRLTGDVSGKETVSLDPTESVEVSFTVVPTKAKVYHVEVDGETGTFEALIPTGSVSGTCVLDGVDIQGIKVGLDGVTCTTDVEGTFHFASVPPGPYTLTFSDPQGHYSPKSMEIVLEPLEDLDVGWVYLEPAPPPPPIVIHGTATGEDTGEPIPYAHLVFYGYGGHPGVSANADENGYYEAETVPGLLSPYFWSTAGYPGYAPEGLYTYIEFLTDTEYNFVVPPAPLGPPPVPDVYLHHVLWDTAYMEDGAYVLRINVGLRNRGGVSASWSVKYYVDGKFIHEDTGTIGAEGWTWPTQHIYVTPEHHTFYCVLTWNGRQEVSPTYEFDEQETSGGGYF